MTNTVLVVEDDFDTLHPLAEMLRLKGYSVTTASEAEKALEIARSQPPDLIITDIVLPGKSGLHFIQSLRIDKRTELVPILVISGCGPMILVEAEASGANFCLEKPINIDLFWNAVEQLLSDNRQKSSPNMNANMNAAPDTAHSLANEIDDLVETLRHCSSKAERDDALKRLKERIIEFQMRKTSCA
ncbi:MAG TPA: response regulator [Blastocatellia bacterium]|nr:response regulator [Blastocatellia bacterium]